MELLEAIRADFMVTMPYFVVFVAMVLADIILGVAAAWAAAIVNSAVSRLGITRKLAMIGIVLLAAVVDGLFPMITVFGMYLPFAALASCFWMLTEAISMTEKAGMLGLPMPKGVKKRLAQLRNSIDLTPGDTNGKD